MDIIIICVILLYSVDGALEHLNVFVGLFLGAPCSVTEHVSHVKHQSVIPYQIQQHRSLIHNHSPFLDRIPKPLNPFLYSVLKVTSKLVLLLLVLTVKLDSKVKHLLFHVPRDAFRIYALDVLRVEEV